MKQIMIFSTLLILLLFSFWRLTIDTLQIYPTTTGSIIVTSFGQSDYYNQK